MDLEHDMRSTCSCWCCALANENVGLTNGAARRPISKMPFTENDLIIARWTDSRDREAKGRRRRNRRKRACPMQGDILSPMWASLVQEEVLKRVHCITLELRNSCLAVLREQIAVADSPQIMGRYCCLNPSSHSCRQCGRLSSHLNPGARFHHVTFHR